MTLVDAPTVCTDTDVAAGVRTANLPFAALFTS
jgi:hypothetical protein